MDSHIDVAHKAQSCKAVGCCKFYDNSELPLYYSEGLFQIGMKAGCVLPRVSDNIRDKNHIAVT